MTQWLFEGVVNAVHHIAMAALAIQWTENKAPRQVPRIPGVPESSAGPTLRRRSRILMWRTISFGWLHSPALPRIIWFEKKSILLTKIF